MSLLKCLSRLDELYEILDVKLTEIECAIDKSNDPDTDGLFDQSEYYVGVGLVAAQQYLAEAATFSGIDKDKAYKLGPRHKSGISYIKAIDSAANYWKHEAEWWKDLDTLNNPNPKVRRHVATVAETSHYQLSNFLYALSNNKEIKLKYLLPIIDEWLGALKS
ncbi:hypothetical protein [Agarivorans sp. Z349TD_8]|uniref:hypothetical protein n=1 Tax=Agarivorans sp. Z349TD_8 TaxID=3421434 RepID=UPI003D7E5B0C